MPRPERTARGPDAALPSVAPASELPAFREPSAEPAPRLRVDAEALQDWVDRVVDLPAISAIRVRVQLTGVAGDVVVAAGSLRDQRLLDRSAPPGRRSRRWSRPSAEPIVSRSREIAAAAERAVGLLTLDLAAGGGVDPVMADLFADRAVLLCKAALLNDSVEAFRRRNRSQGDELRSSQRAFRLAFEESVVGMAMISTDPADPGRFLRVNDALCRLTGRSKAELTRLTFTDITHPEDGGQDESALRRAMAGRRTPFRTEKRYLHADGGHVWVRVTATPLFDDDGIPLCLLTQVEDLRERSDHATETAARTDGLTGLLNPAAFADSLTQAGDRARRHDTSAAVYVAQIDAWKEISDRYGPDMTSALQIRIAERLRRELRADDALSRIGDNEFAFIAEEITAGDAENLARRINAALAEPETINGQQITLQASLGVTLLVGDAPGAGELLHQARRAMTAARTGGGGTHVLYSSYGPTEPAPPSTRRVLWADPHWRNLGTP